MKTIVFLCGALAVAAPLAAQTRTQPVLAAAAHASEPLVTVRAFFLAAEEQFAAKTTFGATFGKASQPLFGGGGQVVFRDGVYVDVSVSRFSKSGQRAFVFGGQSFGVGIPLTATLTPIEASVGYRFRLRHYRNIIPFVAAGIGRYHYIETSSETPSGGSTSTDLDASHTGYLANAGVEFRFLKWVGASVDAQYTHVPGIFGTGGISQDAGENDLGGYAARVKVIVGR
jgi:outer membrane protein W